MLILKFRNRHIIINKNLFIFQGYYDDENSL